MKIRDNTFEAEIFNTSRFSVEIDLQTILPGKRILHKLPLHESSLYDGWTVQYKIPLSETSFCLHSEKMTVADGQSIFEIKNPKSISETESYIIIKNNYRLSIQLTSTERNFLPIFLEGKVNGSASSSNYYIPSGKIGVVKARDISFLFIKDDTGLHSVFKSSILRPSHIFTYEYDGNDVRLADARPLVNIGEPSEEAAIPDAFSPCRLLRGPVDGALYIVVTETARDFRGCPFLRGAVFYSAFPSEGRSPDVFAPFEAADGGDVQFFDAAALADGGIVAVGQTADSGGVAGIAVRYSARGAILNAVRVPQGSTLAAVCVSSDGTIYAAGTGANGTVLVVSISGAAELACEEVASIRLDGDGEVRALPMCASDKERCVFLSVDREFAAPELYKVSLEDGRVREISLGGLLAAASSLVLKGSGMLLVCGSAEAGGLSCAAVCAVAAGQELAESAWISPKPDSSIYISLPRQWSNGTYRLRRGRFWKKNGSVRARAFAGRLPDSLGANVQRKRIFGF